MNVYRIIITYKLADIMTNRLKYFFFFQFQLGICLQLLASYLTVDLLFQLIRFINRSKELEREFSHTQKI